MHARLFRYIKTLSHTSSKVVLLALFVLGAVLFSTVSVRAQTEAQRLKYANYFNLFDSTNSGLFKPAKGYLIRDASNNNVTGVKVDVKLQFNTVEGRDFEDNWEYVEDDGGNPQLQEAFVIRLCNVNNPAQCFVQLVPYNDNLNVFPYPVLSHKDTNDDWTPTTSLSDFSVLGNIRSGGQSPETFFTYTRNATDSRNEGVISDYQITILNNTSYEATLWYCAANVGSETGESAYQGGDGMNGTVATFGELCGEGRSFFRIGSPLTLEIPAATDTAAINAATNNSTGSGSTAVAPPADNLPTCGVVPGFQKGTVVGCLAQLVYYGIYTPIEWIAGLFGSLFDFFIGYSVSDESYRYPFAVTGWKLVRDIANIMFIIILVYAGFSAVFNFGGGKGGTTLKKLIPALIINALIINFSLFATRTVIDISNITARVFYSRMVVCDGECRYENSATVPVNIKRGLGGHWPLSEKIVSAFNPQKMFRTVTLNPKESSSQNTNDPFNSTNTAQKFEAQQQKGFEQNSMEYAGYYALVSLIAAIIMFAIAAMFFNVTFMFVGRVIGLYMAMIFSPFAFLTLNGGGGFFKIKGYEWESWIKDLSNYALLAPIFTFFLYIVYSFLNTDIAKQIGVEDTTGGFFGTVLSIVIPMLFIYFLVSQGTKTAKEYAGKFGNLIQDKISGAVGGIGGVIGGGVGLAAGAGAFLGTGLGARAGKAIGNSSLGKWAASNADNNKAARFFNNGLSKTQTGSWDFRKTGLNKALNTGVSKLSMGQVSLQDRMSGLVGLDSARFEGGAVAMRKAREEEIKKSLENRISYAHLSDDQAREMWARHQDRKVEEQAIKDHAYASNTEYKAAADIQKEKEKSVKEMQKEIAETKKKLTTEAYTLTQQQKEEQQKIITDREKDISTAKKEIADAKTKQAAQLVTIKGTTDKNSAEYQATLKKTKDAQKEKDLKTYGEIKNGKELTNAMRRDYIEDKRNNSLWMKDGEQRNLFGIGKGAFVGGALQGLGALGAAASFAAGQIINDRIKFEQEAFDAATQSYIKDYGKTKGKDSKTDQLTKKIKEYEETIKANAQAKMKNDDLEKQKTNPNHTIRTEQELKNEVEAMDNDKRSEYANNHIDDLQAEYDFRNTQYKKSEEHFNNGTINSDDLKMASKERKKAEDNLNKAKNAAANKAKAEAELEKEKEKNNPK